MFWGELVKKKKKRRKKTMRYHMWYFMPESNKKITGQKGNANLVAIAIQDMIALLPSNC